MLVEQDGSMTQERVIQTCVMLSAAKNPRIFAFAFRFLLFVLSSRRDLLLYLPYLPLHFWIEVDLQPKPWRPKGAFMPAVKAQAPVTEKHAFTPAVKAQALATEGHAFTPAVKARAPVAEKHAFAPALKAG